MFIFPVYPSFRTVRFKSEFKIESQRAKKCQNWTKLAKFQLFPKIVDSTNVETISTHKKMQRKIIRKCNKNYRILYGIIALVFFYVAFTWNQGLNQSCKSFEHNLWHFFRYLQRGSKIFAAKFHQPNSVNWPYTVHFELIKMKLSVKAKSHSTG